MTATTVRARRGAHGALGFRPDIEGLRAVAVLLVVAHHLGWPGFEAGYIGVDVFFVISGFLIARKLLDELAMTGTLDLGRFWAARVRRLLPLSATVITATVAASLVVLNPMRWDAVLADARAGALFVGNEHLARSDQGYFAPSTRESPFLHLWSLGVEEQFYVVLPLLLALALRLRRDEGSSEVPALLVVGLSLGSAIGCAVFTSMGTPFAYYSLLARGWELAAGVLLAFAWGRIGFARQRLAPVSAALGAAMLVVGLVAVERSTGFPAWGAVFPVTGTVLLICSEPSRPSVLGRALTARGMRAIGRWSYGWYLWHWPFLVLGRYLLGSSVVVSAALAGSALAVSAFTHRTIEVPGRHLAGRPSRVLAVGAAGTVGLLLVVHLGSAWTDRYFSQPSRSQLRTSSTDWVDIPKECFSVEAEQISDACRSVGPTGVPPVLLYGDSHMSHWRPAIESAAASLGVPIVHSILGNCFPYGEGQADPPPFCAERAAGFDRLVDELRPAAVIVSTATVYRTLLDDGEVATDQAAAWTGAVRHLAEKLREAEVPLLFMLDTPRYERWDPIECMAEHGVVPRCARTRAQEVKRQAVVNAAIRRAIDAAGHGEIFDALDITCPDATCLLVDGELVVPLDGHHVTARWAASQEPVFRRLLGQLLRLGYAGQS